ncbi:MAG: hypothetical protein Q9163_004388 [Psora crenata]
MFRGSSSTSAAFAKVRSRFLDRQRALLDVKALPPQNSASYPGKPLAKMPQRTQPPSPSKPLRQNAGNPLVLAPDNPHPRQHLKETDINQGHARKLPYKIKGISLVDAENVDPEKKARSSKTLLSLLDRDKKPFKKQVENNSGHPKIKKSKSSTSVSTIFSRPGSSKGKRRDQVDEQKDKENHTPPEPPIWAQFATRREHSEISSTTKVPLNDRQDLTDHMALHTPPQHYSPTKQRNFPENQQPTFSERSRMQPRPKSECLSATTQASFPEPIFGLRRPRHVKEEAERDLTSSRKTLMNNENTSRKPYAGEKPSEGGTPALTVGKPGSRVMAAVAAFNGKTKELPKEPTKELATSKLDPQAIEREFESLLEARNVPQNTRDKMRSLDTNIKADFIKQDKTGSGSGSAVGAEGDVTQVSRPGTGKRSKTDNGMPPVVDRQLDSSHSSEAPKKSRPRSRTFTFSKGEGSPTKKQRSDRSESHHSSKSSEIISSDSSKSLASLHAMGKCSASLFGKANVFTTPEDCIAYLRKFQQPQEVEVGKVHKLWQLLRNETVEWVNSFIMDGGMTEVVSLLYRIIGVEWREEHEDSLLHETLACLKALTTTSLALEHLTTMHNILFPRLLGLLFSEERKGPSDFPTRTIIIRLASRYLSSAPRPNGTARAHHLLSYLRDPSRPEAAQPPGFIATMHQPRPYRVWNKEITDVTKDVFWIFLHHMNIIPSPHVPAETGHGPSTYLDRHFPQPHPPMPTAPYIGGVEWEAMSYLTAHVDLLNGLLASLPTRGERNALRQEFKDSGFEKVMGGSLRTCKEKFYSSVHLALSTWVGAAQEDGWDVKGVRDGALPASTTPNSPTKSPVKKGKVVEKAPVLAMPKLDLGPGGMGQEDGGGWL